MNEPSNPSNSSVATIPVGVMREAVQLIMYDMHSDVPIPGEAWRAIVRYDVAWRRGPNNSPAQNYVLFESPHQEVEDITESEFESYRTQARQRLGKYIPSDTIFETRLIPLPPGLKIARYV
jgi:hypothetical protein